MSRWTCPTCGAVFLDQSAMKDHALLFHRDGEGNVEAVLAEAIGASRILRTSVEEQAHAALAALTAKGIRCLYIPEGVEMEHGARLVRLSGKFSDHFVIEVMS